MDSLSRAWSPQRPQQLRCSGSGRLKVDIATPDLECSLTAAGGTILEVNGLPVHYRVATKESRPRSPFPALSRPLQNR